MIAKTKNKVDIPSLFKPLYTTKKRYIILTGGRGSLKSSTVHDFIIRLTFETGHGVLFTRYTMTSAEKSIIPEFKVVAKRLGVLQFFKITKTLVTNNLTGSFIIFSGIKTSSGDQTANLKSISGITTFVVEEGEDFNNEDSFDKIDESVRSKERQNRVVWIQNPSTKEHFIYKRFIEKSSKQMEVKGHKVTISNHPQVEHIHSTYHVAKQYLNPSWLKKAEQLAITNPKKYYHRFLGGWLEKAEGVIFENWIEGKFDDSLLYGFGLDFGFFPDPLALIKVAIDYKSKKIYAKEVIYDTKLNDEILIKLISRSVNKNELIVCDTNEPRTILKIKQAGFNIQKAAKGKGSIVADIRDIQDYQLIIDYDSHNLKTELNNYVWNDKKSSIPIDDYNHLIDAMRYIFRRLTRKTKSIKRRN